jgi:hypothetical protein
MFKKLNCNEITQLTLVNISENYPSKSQLIMSQSYMYILNKGENRARQTLEKEEEAAATAVPG